ncbi:hypothetical protein [Roseibium sp.]
MTRAGIEQRKRAAIALLRKEGLSAKIGLTFLKQFGGERHRSE